MSKNRTTIINEELIVFDKPIVQPRQITTCAGIGDYIWLAMKLINQKEKFHWILPDGTPQRGHQILNLLPQIVASHEYAPNLKYSIINNNNEQKAKRYWKNIDKKKFYLSANEHLEQGRRIEEWLPDLPTSFKLDYATTEEDKQTAAKLLNEARPYIGIYTSAYSNARHWGGWSSVEWLKLLRLMNKKNICFVFIGAPYDIGITEELMISCKEFGIPYVDTIGQNLSCVIEMLKTCKYFFGFPSGLSILNESLEKDGLMFYAPHIKGIINAWANPERIKNHNYKGCLFCEPEKIYDWVKNEYKLFEKI